MADKSISQKAVEQLAILGTEESGTLSPLLKTPHSKNITLSDWNEFLHVSDRNLADVKRVYEVLKKALPELENYTAEQVAAILTTIQAINTTLGQHQDDLTTLNTTFSKQISDVNAKLSANSVADAEFKKEASSKFEAQGTRINTAFSDIAQLNKADVAKISVEDTGNFGVYTLRISFNDGRSVSTEFDLPLEAVQIASVDDTFIDDERCLVITFVDENVTPLVVKLDEIFSIEALESLTRPYDVATERVMLGYQQTYLKLTIDNLLDGHYESFQPFDMVCLGSDGYPMSSLCTVTVESYDSVKMLVYNTKGMADNLCPKYYTSEDGNVYLYFDADCEHLQVFIRGLVEKCTGATLEIVDVLPDGVVGINIERHLNEDYVSYTANGVTQKRPIGHDAKAYSIVCRNSASGINVRTPGPGKSYADTEAVNYGYLRDVMLPEALANAGGGGEPYDIVTERVTAPTKTGEHVFKLTIDNLNDGVLGGFQIFELACDGEDGVLGHTATLCKVAIDASKQGGHVSVASTLDFGIRFKLHPRYYSTDGKYTLYFNTAVEVVQVYIHGITERCTGATLEYVDALPDDVTAVDFQELLDADYVSYGDADGSTFTSKKRPIGDTPQAHGIVCRNEDKGIEVRSLGSGETYADNEAVPLSYIRDTMLPTAGGGLTENDSNTLIGEAEGTAIYLSNVSSTEEFVTCDLVDANLIQLADGIETIENVEFKTRNGIVTVYGGAIGKDSDYLIAELNSIPAGAQFVLSGCPEGGSPSTYCLKTSEGVYDIGEGVSFTGGSSFSVYVHLNQGASAVRIKFKPVLRRVNIPSSVEVRRFGKNLALPPLTAITNRNGLTATPNSDGTVTVSGSHIKHDSADKLYLTRNGLGIKLLPNVKYSVSAKKDGVSFSSAAAGALHLDISGVQEVGTQLILPCVVTPRNNATLNGVYMYTDGDYVAGTYSIQLEAGEVPTEHEKAIEDVYNCEVVDGRIEIPSLSNITLNAVSGVGLRTVYTKNITADLRERFEDVNHEFTKYAKFTDYAGNNTAGVVEVSDRYGVAMVDYSGNQYGSNTKTNIAIRKASEDDIDAKQDAYKPIVPSNLEYAVKSVTYDKAEIDKKVSGSYASITAVPGAVVLPETTSAVGALENGIAVIPTISLNVGSRYWVTYNGTEYVCECFDGYGDGTPVLGRRDDTSAEPFIIIVMDGMCACVPQDGSTSVTVSIIGEKMQVPLEQIPTVDVSTALPLTYIEGEYVEEYGGYMYQAYGGLPVTPGSTYEVFFDNKTYTCVAKEAVIEDTPLILLGNDMVFGGTSSEPFIVLTDGSSMHLLCTFTEGEHVIRVTTPAKFVNGIAFSDTQIAAIEALIDAKLKEL